MAYITDATSLSPGSIVKVEKPLSASRRPTYPHFFIVLAVPEPLHVDEVIPLVGISSRINPISADPSMHVAMKWLNRKGGDPETGFTKPCYACMDFTHQLCVYAGKTFSLEVEAENQEKFVRADKLKTVVATMNAWMRRKV